MKIKSLRVLIILIVFIVVASFMVSSTQWYDFGGFQVGIEKIQSCETVTTTYTCDAPNSFFNFTLSPKKEAWCFNSTQNGTITQLFTGFFTRANLSTKTVWLDKTTCIDTGNANVYLNKSGKQFKWMCDYSKWGNCMINESSKQLVCDSKYDGNGDGRCDSGESCLIMNVSKQGLVKLKSKGFHDAMLKYDINCELQ